MKQKRKTSHMLRRSWALLLVCSLVMTTVVSAAEEVQDTEADTRTYQSSYSSKEEVNEAALEVNMDVAREGMVLMRNENDTLPLLTSDSDKTKVSIFGYAAIDPALGGGDSMDDQSAGYVTEETDIFSTLENAGYEVNPVIWQAYTEWNDQVDEEDNAIYGSDQAVWNSGDGDGSALMTDELTASYEEYNDAAVVVLHGTGYSADQSEYYYKSNDEVLVEDDQWDPEREGEAIQTTLTYDTEQKEMVEYVTSMFDKVIVLINRVTPHEVDWLDKMVDEGKIDAILQIGESGNGGLHTIGEVLTGEVTPSGHTSDLWAADLTATPSFVNLSPSNYTTDDGSGLGYYVTYEEGIYVGYRYYETVAYEMNQTDGSGDEWYDSKVTYPFGYGLSYTTFDWELVDSDVPASLSESAVDEEMTITVKVTNTGDYAGKDVVQLYYSAPYYEGSTIEKSSVALGSYVKTDLLQPGESQEVSLTITPSDIASYDYVDAKTYVLEAGEYALTLQTDSHSVKDGTDSITFTVESNILCNTGENDTEITNQFDDLNEYMTTDDVEQLSRTDMIGTTASTWNLSDHITSGGDGKENTYASVEEFEAAYVYKDPVEGDPNYVDESDMPVYAEEGARGEKADIQLSEMMGVDLDDPKWDEFMDQLSLNDMYNLICYAGYFMYDSEYLGVPMTLNTDGPKGWTGIGANGEPFAKLASEPMIASTWNTDLLYELGQMMSEEGLWGNSDNGDEIYNYTGLYGPGINIHRTPFDTRYDEYYSEDAYLTGTLAASYCQGVEEKGCFTYIKHLCMFNDASAVKVGFNITRDSDVNDERANGLAEWCNEQVLREIYLRPFQISIEEGDTDAVMSTSTRIGTIWNGASYPLITNVLRGEWGFDGVVVTDIVTNGIFNSEAFIYAGGNMMLEGGMGMTPQGADLDIFVLDEEGDPVIDESTGDGVIDPDKITATKVSAMREASKAILYTVCNSNSMQTPYGAAVIYADDCEPASLNDGEVGSEYEGAVAQARVNTYYAYSDVSYAVTDGSLPAGLELDETTGAVTGTPAEAGDSTFTVTAYADGYTSASAEYTITITE